MVFTQNNNDGTPTGELNYGDDFTIEQLTHGKWEAAKIVLKGDYGFNSIAYIIPPNGSSKRELRWEWLYGSLNPGTYKINKTVSDFRGPGNNVNYKISAQFKIN